jgi:hypothetical protein
MWTLRLKVDSSSWMAFDILLFRVGVVICCQRHSCTLVALVTRVFPCSNVCVVCFFSFHHSHVTETVVSKNTIPLPQLLKKLGRSVRLLLTEQITTQFASLSLPLLMAKRLKFGAAGSKNSFANTRRNVQLPWRKSKSVLWNCENNREMKVPCKTNNGKEGIRNIPRCALISCVCVRERNITVNDGTSSCLLINETNAWERHFSYPATIEQTSIIFIPNDTIKLGNKNV